MTSISTLSCFKSRSCCFLCLPHSSSWLTGLNPSSHLDFSFNVQRSNATPSRRLCGPVFNPRVPNTSVGNTITLQYQKVEHPWSHAFPIHSGAYFTRAKFPLFSSFCSEIISQPSFVMYGGLVSHIKWYRICIQPTKSSHMLFLGDRVPCSTAGCPPTSTS